MSLIDRVDPELRDPDVFAWVVQCCERLHRQGMPLSPAALQGELQSGGQQLTIPQLTKILQSDRLAAALQARGIDFAPLDALSAHQMHALTIYMDTSVPMTHRERLRNAKVTQAQWDGWMRNPRFAARLEEVAEDRLATGNANAMLRLQEAVDRGERWAVELQLEMTGRHRRGTDQTNPTELFAAMFEILDEAGVPQATMRAVGERMKQLALPGSAPARVATHILTPTGQPAANITSLEE